MAKAEKKGRPALWDELNMPDMLESIEGWCKEGATDQELYEHLEISKSVFYKWKREFPQFKHALKSGKREANGEILNSAFKQACGYYYTEVQPIKVKVDIHTEEIRMIEVTKFQPPSPAMSIFMLKNRLTNDYRDKHEVDHGGEVKHEHEFTGAAETLKGRIDDLAERRKAREVS